MAGLIPLGISIGGGLLGGKLLGGPSKEQKAVLGQQQDTMAQARRMAGSLEGQGGNLLNMAQGAYNPVLDYWTRLLRGGSQATSVLAPEYAQIGQGYRAANQAASELMPRGGGRASLMQTLPYQQMAQQQGLAQSLRPQAAGQLGQLAGSVASAGSSLMSNAIQSLYASTSAGRSILDATQQQREEAGRIGRDISQMLLDQFEGGGIELPPWLGGKKKTT
ncbi:MAG TPA: hypothetical protein VFC19_22490 [Candidatus Limnocylindrales bacterium]|nr:hypothetical protein [Candidatus Limnocylindrales bacterium]